MLAVEDGSFSLAIVSTVFISRWKHMELVSECILHVSVALRTCS